jgi:hypothetical protein
LPRATSSRPTWKNPWWLLGAGGVLVAVAMASLAVGAWMAYVALGLGAAFLVAALTVGLVTR